MESDYDPKRPIYQSNEHNGRLSTHSLLDYFKETGAMRVSDLHLKVGQPPCYRVDGQIRRMKGRPLDDGTVRQIVFSLLDEHDRQIASQKQEVDASYHYGEFQFRIHVFFDSEGIAVAIRALPVTIPEVEQVGFPNAVWKDIIQREHGLVLVTGITGAGKSTTIAAMIERINRTKACRIITLEDPIEYVYKQDRALISQREIGRDAASFTSGLRAMMREDPDVIFVGEMRDAESISMTLTAAETGHLVFSTLHTRDARGTITRILDSFPAGKREEVQNQLSLGLAYVLSQKLLPRRDGNGRALAMEVLTNNYSVANLIRTDRVEQIYTQLQTKTKDQPDERMVTLERSIANLVWAGVVDERQARLYVNDLNSYEDALQRTTHV